MEDLIAIALFYSYVVNGKRELPDYTISAFVSDVQKALSVLRSKYDINEKKSRGFYDSIPGEINVRREDIDICPFDPSNKELDPRSRKYANQPTLYYSFASIDRDIMGWFRWLDNDLVCATLSKDALDHLNIKRDSLPIRSIEEVRSGKTSIYSLVESEAYEKAVRYLEEDGYRELSVGRGFPEQLGDKAYTFYFTGKKDIDTLYIHDDSMLEIIANLKTILDMEAYKKEVLFNVDENGKLNLDNLWLAKTSLLDKDNNAVSHDYRAVLKLTGDEESFYNRMVASMESGSSDVTVFIDLLGDEIMNFAWQGKFSNKKFERVVDDISLLSDSMGMESATLEEIEKHVDELNKKPVMKELKPDNGNK